MLAIQENRAVVMDSPHRVEAPMRIEMTVADFLCSRLCHDLVGPISAVGNGLELLAENPQLEEEAVALARRSAGRAGALVQFYRLAFGNAGNQLVRATEAQAAAQGLFQDGRTRLEWTAAEGVSLPPGGAKLLLNMLMLTGEALPRGGKVAVSLRGEPDGVAAEVAALGSDAKLPDEVAAALAAVNPPADLNPRTVQAYYLGRLAAGFGLRLEPQTQAPGELRFRVRLPAA
jgi:histidine phosphotransferase ChpT